MKVDQLSIFLENRSGRLAQVTSLLAENEINIRALSLADTTDFGILRLIVSDFDKAEKCLKKEGLTVGRTAVVAVEIDDTPGSLHNLLDHFADESVNINVEYMYAFVQELGRSAAMILRFDKTEAAIELLAEKGVKLISQEALQA
ncbi:MAG: ACT domain-containing protein [Desulfovibrio sp.]